MPLVKEKSQVCGILLEPTGHVFWADIERGQGGGRTEKEISMYCPSAVGHTDAIVKSWVLAKPAGLGLKSRESHPEGWSGALQPTCLTSCPSQVALRSSSDLGK